MANIVNGNLLLHEDNIIIHQVNCRDKMGKGLALLIRNKYPKVYKEYLEMCSDNNYDPDKLLGRVQIVKINEDKYVANIFSQDGYGYDDVYTDYVAMFKALKQLSFYAKANQYSIGAPYKIGCNLGGGNWNKVSAIIEQTLSENDYRIIRKED